MGSRKVEGKILNWKKTAVFKFVFVKKKSAYDSIVESKGLGLVIFLFPQEIMYHILETYANFLDCFTGFEANKIASNVM